VEPFLSQKTAPQSWSLNGPSHPLQIGGIKKMNEEEYRQKKLAVLESIAETLAEIERKM